uniref:Uncharacterized protein n=1 Tax=Anguilla anguilla TaxID=7936 RepID=A0A0E9T155_ANGAN
MLYRGMIGFVRSSGKCPQH